MSIRKKILSDINKFMDINDMSEVPRDWRMNQAIFLLKQIESEVLEAEAKKEDERLRAMAI
jgi:hypothetical protein